MGFIENIDPEISVHIWNEGMTFVTEIENREEYWHQRYGKLSDAYRYAADRFLDLEHQARISELQERINKL